MWFGFVGHLKKTREAHHHSFFYFLLKDKLIPVDYTMWTLNVNLTILSNLVFDWNANKKIVHSIKNISTWCSLCYWCSFSSLLILLCFYPSHHQTTHHSLTLPVFLVQVHLKFWKTKYPVPPPPHHIIDSQILYVCKKEMRGWWWWWWW